MKNAFTFAITTVVIFLIGSLFIASFLEKILNSYQTVEGSFHLPTHAGLIMLTGIIAFCTKLIINKLNELKDELRDKEIK